MSRNRSGWPISDNRHVQRPGIRIALGPHQGRKAFTLRTLAPDPWAEERSIRVAQASAFSRHAGVLAEAGEREKLVSFR